MKVLQRGPGVTPEKLNVLAAAAAAAAVFSYLRPT